MYVYKLVPILFFVQVENDAVVALTLRKGYPSNPFALYLILINSTPSCNIGNMDLS